MAALLARDPSRSPSIFPLAVSANGRYLQTAQGAPFFIHGNSYWSLEVQCTRLQIDQALAYCQQQGFNAILFEAFEHDFSSQSPAYRNAEGNDPFTTMSPTDFSTANNAYWTVPDYIVEHARAMGMVCFIAYAYYGINSTEGWQTELTADTSAHLQAYGAFLANRYGNAGNIIWTAGGDNTAGAAIDAQIITGMRSVRTDQLITGHSARGNDGYSKYNAQAGFNVNSQYSNNAGIVGDAATCYGRPGPLPFVLLENEYENATGQSNLTQRVQAYQSLCSGACGHFFGCDPMWSFCAPTDNFSGSGGGGPGQALAVYLNTTATQHQANIPRLFTGSGYAWQKLVPQTGTQLVTTALGTGATAICPALASDGTFAFIAVPNGGTFTVNLAALSVSSVPARWFDPVSGSFSTATGSPFTNSGTHAFTAPGSNAGGDPDFILVLG